MTILDSATNIDELIAHFAEIVQQNIQPPLPQGDLIQQLEALNNLNYKKLNPNSRADAESKRKQTALNLIKQQVASRIAEIFPPIDQRLFELSRWVEVIWGSESESPTLGQEWRYQPPDLTLVGESLPRRKRADGEPLRQVMKLPLIVARSSRLSQYRIQHPRIRSSWSGWHEIRCSFPGNVPPDLEHQASKALAMFYQVMTEVVRTSWRDVTMAELALRPPTVDAIWIPRLQDISTVPVPPQTRDPALVIRYAHRTFFVGLWEVPEEEPLEHLLGEFTTGALLKG